MVVSAARQSVVCASDDHFFRLPIYVTIPVCLIPTFFPPYSAHDLKVKIVQAWIRGTATSVEVKETIQVPQRNTAIVVWFSALDRVQPIDYILFAVVDKEVDFLRWLGGRNGKNRR